MARAVQIELALAPYNSCDGGDQLSDENGRNRACSTAASVAPPDPDHRLGRWLVPAPSGRDALQLDEKNGRGATLRSRRRHWLVFRRTGEIIAGD